MPDQTSKEKESIRIHKWMANQGIASRREAERWIKSQRILVNGRVCVTAQSIVPSRDIITLDGITLTKQHKHKHYVILYKPRGYLVSRRSQGGKPTIYQLPKVIAYCKQILQNQEITQTASSFWLPAVGRLDYESEGLLLLTNDGITNHRLTHPTFEHTKEYYVCVNSAFLAKDIQHIHTGVHLQDGKLSQVTIRALTPQDPWQFPSYQASKHATWYIITIKEGRKHVIRRLCAKFHKSVHRLLRTKMGPFSLPLSLKPGDVHVLPDSITEQTLEKIS